MDIGEWLNEISGDEYVWFIKRLSANDTLANNTHQAGPYIPKDFLFKVFPSLNNCNTPNPDVNFNISIDSHNDLRKIRAVWYNNIFFGGTRNETRLTRFGGRQSPVLDPENTGALAAFSFRLDGNAEAAYCHAWICRNVFEETIIEERIGPVEPGKFIIWTENKVFIEKSDTQTRTDCWLKLEEIPSEWIYQFPTGEEIIRKSIEIGRNLLHGGPDDRLLKRRECEYEIFRSLEEAVELPEIMKGFTTIDDFIGKAQTILQRRKSRSGRSLELHLKGIFIEEGLEEEKNFSHQPESEPGKQPDFLFPSESAYKNHDFPDDKLRMLAIKTTLKDRWRQVLNEADRINSKHLLTLQEGVSLSQFREMQQANVKLVVPARIIPSYPQTVQPFLLDLDKFIKDIRLLGK